MIRLAKKKEVKEEIEPVEISPGIALLYSQIDAETAQAITEWIIMENLSPTPSEILTLMINSEGGDLNAAWAIIEVITASRIPVRTVAIGECASAALFICMAGAKGNRIVTPSCSVMSHNFSSGAAGSYEELRDTQKVFDQVDKTIMDHYVKYTGLSSRVIRSKLLNHKDNYLTSVEAVKYGLFDISMGLQGLFEEIQHVPE